MIVLNDKGKMLMKGYIGEGCWLLKYKYSMGGRLVDECGRNAISDAFSRG
jgi:hypothetical protein